MKKIILHKTQQRPSHCVLKGRNYGRAWRRWCLVSAVMLMALLCVWLPGGAMAAPSDLDLMFNGNGFVTANFGDIGNSVRAIAIQPDGKIIAAGLISFTSGKVQFLLTRYKVDGTLDLTFDGDGRVTTAIGTNSAYLFAVAIQPDGKIVAAGYAINVTQNGIDFALVRYNIDGSLDTTFDGDGKVTTAFGSTSTSVQAIAVQPDGKIIAAGDTFDGSTGSFALARYNADGSLDSTFGSAGKVITGGGSRVNAVSIQSDGKIIAAGVGRLNPDSDFALVRYNPNGSLDTSFDGDGKVFTDFNSNSYEGAFSSVIQPDGKIVVAGYIQNINHDDFAVARYNADGSLDLTFDGDGKVVTAIGNGFDEAFAVALQSNGKIVVAGRAETVASYDFALARYNPNGSLDMSFDSDGRVITSFSSGEYDGAQAVAIQPDGKIIAAGSVNLTGGGSMLALTRYVGDSKPNRTANFDTDRKTDVAVWNPANGNWFSFNSTDGSSRAQFGWGAAGDRIVPGDYDGDTKTDYAVWREAEGNWYIIQSSTGTATLINWGGAGDIPVAGDYDLDGKTDAAIYRASEGNWYIRNSRDSSVTLKNWGASGDRPVPADYDGDGRTDIAVFRPSDSNWYIITSEHGFVRVVNWGNSSDRLVPADYDGDGRTDVAIFRPSESNWYIRNSTGGVVVRNWGGTSDVAVPADYDGDGRADIAVFRPVENNWYILESGTGMGRLVNSPPGVPVLSAYLPPQF